MPKTMAARLFLLQWLVSGAFAFSSGVGAQPQILVETDGNEPTGSDLAVGQTLDGPVLCSELREFVDQAPKKMVKRLAPETEERWRERILGEVVLNQRLAAEGLAAGATSNRVFLQRWNQFREQLLFATLERELGSGIVIRSEEIERHYEQHREKFSSPEKITTQLIMLKLPADADSDSVHEAEERLRSIREEHAAGTPFGELARRHSQAENAGRGGIVAGSPRGSLLPQFEEAAWKLKPGEVSPVVRLPDGVALIMLNKRLEPRHHSLEEARAGIAKSLRHGKALEQRKLAMAEVCSPWPPRIDGELTDATVLLELAGEAVLLRDLKVDLQQPHWRAKVENTLAGLCRGRLAADRGSQERPEVADKLRFRYESLLAAYAMDQRLKAKPPEVPEEQLTALYEEHRQHFEIPEERTFEAVLIPVDDDRLRPAQTQGRAVVEQWRGLAGSPPEALARELWGPLSQSALSASTSPFLAKQAFALERGEISEPLRLESYQVKRSRFETEGYVVLKLVQIEGKTYQPFEEVRGSVLRYAARDEFDQLSAQVRRTIVLEAKLRIDQQALSTCQLAMALDREAPAEFAAEDEEVSSKLP